MNSLNALLRGSILGALLGVSTTVITLTAVDDFVLVRDVYGAKAVKYRGDYYKLVRVEMKAMAEIVE